MLLLLLACLPAGDDPAPLNDGVLAFARSKLGEQVGDGECTSLAMAALREAGARLRSGPGAARWGEPLDTPAQARPGDILQFEDATFVRKTRQGRGISTQRLSFPHHTAIVAAVRTVKGATVLTILHQNVGKAGESEDQRRRVREWQISLADLTGGTIRAYRPVADGIAPTSVPGVAGPRIISGQGESSRPVDRPDRSPRQTTPAEDDRGGS